MGQMGKFNASDVIQNRMSVSQLYFADEVPISSCSMLASTVIRSISGQFC